MSEVLCPYCGDEMRHVATRWSDAEYYECKGCHSRSPSANCMKVKEVALTRKDSPVVHSRWVKDTYNGRTSCSACKVGLPRVWYYNGEDEDENCEEIDSTPYCPNCGAKMDAKEEV